jgi:hypothetical protein
VRILLSLCLAVVLGCGPIEDIFSEDERKPISRSDCVAQLRECLASLATQP